MALMLLVLAGPVAAEGGHGEGDVFEPHHHLSFMLGYALERKRFEDEEATAIGLDYGYRVHQNWSIGGFVERLSSETSRDASVGVVINFYPLPRWSLFTGPGYEFNEKHNSALFRVGTGYDFELPNRWTFGPKFIYDMIESGKRTYIIGVALGREF